jgi:altronate dehydratase small subunit
MKSEEIDKKLILSHLRDNVATAKSPMKAGTILLFAKKKIIAKDEIPFGHKVALQKIPKRGAVIKYGERIGRAIRPIEPGELVHIHNVEGERGKGKGRKKG